MAGGPIALAEGIADQEEIPALVRAAAAEPAAKHKFDRTVATQAVNVWMRRLCLDQGRWPEFRDWLLKRKPEYDQELILVILRDLLAALERH